MRKFTLLFSALLMGALASNAQSVATFEDLSLSKPDTFYVNYTASGTDVGFNEADVHFPCVYDTSYGGYWSYGFSYSNMTDSVTSGYLNGYSAKPAIGYGSAQYAVAYGTTNTITLLDTADMSPAIGMYVTNNTYAANDMRDGDGPSGPAKKFGGTTGNDPDWFKLTIHGYRHGAELPDSVDFYLADYRFVDNDSDYIVNTWKYVDLSSLGAVDTYEFDLSSSDTGAFGMNTPAYFCMDNFTFNTTTAVHNTPAASVAKVYPNPATNMLYVDMSDNSVQQISLMNVSGSVINTYNVMGKQLAINTASLPSGMYLLQLSGNGKNATVRFVKQ